MFRGLVLPAFFAFALIQCSKGPNGPGSGDPVGNYAKEFLTATTYTKLVVEIQAMQGFAPTQATRDNLSAFLAARLNKPDGIEIVVDPEIAAQGKSSYTIEDVAAIEDANRTRYASGTQLAAYALFLDGPSSSDTGSQKVLGHAYRAQSLVLYEATIHSLSGIPVTQPSRTVLESTVLLHEVGHLIGLVNTGSAPQTAHHDSAHGAHCTNTSCLMYYLSDTGDIVSNLLGGSVPSLDAACIQDLQANGGK